MLLYSPRWLFLAPGLFLMLAGGALGVILSFGNIHLGQVQLDVGSLAVTCMGVIVGLQLVAFAFFTKVFAIAEGLLPQDPKFSNVFKIFTLEKGIVAGIAVLIYGAGLLAYSIHVWKSAHYGPLDASENLRRLLPAVTLVVVGIQVVFSSFFLSMLGLKTASRKPPTLPA
jgi:hypothetical protein